MSLDNSGAPFVTGDFSVCQLGPSVARWPPAATAMRTVTAKEAKTPKPARFATYL